MPRTRTTLDSERAKALAAHRLPSTRHLKREDALIIGAESGGVVDSQAAATVYVEQTRQPIAELPVNRADVTDANARLIADAPRLLARVERLEEALRKIVNLSNHPYFPSVNDLPSWAVAISAADGLLSTQSAGPDGGDDE